MSVKSMTIHSIDLAEDNGLQSHTHTDSRPSMLYLNGLLSGALGWPIVGLALKKKKMHNLQCKCRVLLLLL